MYYYITFYTVTYIALRLYIVTIDLLRTTGSFGHQKAPLNHPQSIATPPPAIPSFFPLRRGESVVFAMWSTGEAITEAVANREGDRAAAAAGFASAPKEARRGARATCATLSTCGNGDWVELLVLGRSRCCAIHVGRGMGRLCRTCGSAGRLADAERVEDGSESCTVSRKKHFFNVSFFATHESWQSP